MVPPPDETPESLDAQATRGGELNRPVEKSLGEGETAGNDPSTDFGGEAFGEDWTPPETLADRYRLEEELGHGGMGVVYRATDTQLVRSIAVNLISRGSVARFGDRSQGDRRAQPPLDGVRPFGRAVGIVHSRSYCGSGLTPASLSLISAYSPTRRSKYSCQS